jgi:hypothetical protein
MTTASDPKARFPYVVRVQGLASDKGKALNGLSARAERLDGFQDDERLAVWIDGVAKPMSLRR